MTQEPIVFWFRRDLRLDDNRGLRAALEAGYPVLSLFIIDPRFRVSGHYSHNRMAFLLQALRSLDSRLRERGAGLLVHIGLPQEILPKLVREHGVKALYFNADYTPFARERDRQVESRLSIPVHAYDDLLLVAPNMLRKGDGSPYRVFTPFERQWTRLAKTPLAKCSFAGNQFHQVSANETNSALDQAAETVRPHAPLPPASEQVAQAKLEAYIKSGIDNYAQTRNNLTIDPFGKATQNGSSCISHYLHQGLLSPRQALWLARGRQQIERDDETVQSITAWIRQLAWRDFFSHIMYHFPQVRQSNFRSEFDNMPWRDAEDELRAWKRGLTGYPIVDAAMRQLAAIGWMPNRARMIVASFLCKDLLIDWREGEAHFMRHLLDGDQAVNNGGWQWAAGTGTDAQPFFRIFNPVLQSKKFDKNGHYIRHWIPELRRVPDEAIHSPWQMSSPPASYPQPIVDHASARERAIKAFRLARTRASKDRADGG